MAIALGVLSVFTPCPSSPRTSTGPIYIVDKDSLGSGVGDRDGATGTGMETGQWDAPKVEGLMMCSIQAKVCHQ